MLLLVMFLLAPFPPSVWAAQSLSLAFSSARQGTFNIPNSAPFPTLGSTRVELRLHSFVPPTGTGTIRYIWRTPGISIFFRSANAANASPNDEICAADLFDTMPQYGNITCIEARNASDVILRVGRDTVEKRFYLDAWSTANGAHFPGYCANPGGKIYGCPMTVVQNRSWSGQGLIGDDNRTDVSVAWIKWYTGYIPNGGQLPHAYDSGDLSDWRFEGNLTNTSRSNMNISFSGATYFDSTSFPPVPVARFLGAPDWTNWISPRAGFPVQLDAAGSYSNTTEMEGGLTYTWTQVDGPTVLFVDDPNNLRPVINGMVAGTYNIRLDVRDLGGLVGSTVLSFGAVASDENGVVIQRDPRVDRILGPQLRFGLSPWPWFDERQKKITEFYGDLLDSSSNYQEYWDNPPSDGTITLTAGSTSVIGTGTAFRTVFSCNGTDELIARWNGGVNRAQFTVVSCQSDTQLTISAAWNRGPTEGAVAFSRVTTNQAAFWYNGSTNNNYYDNVMAHYSMYYRTGHTRYLNRARQLADAWWRMPLIDQGKNAVNGFGMVPRTRSLGGLFLRALDGRPEILEGLRPLWENERGVVSGGNWPAEDIREHGYEHYFFALASMFDSDAENRSRYASYLSQGLTNKWAPALRSQNISALETITWFPPLNFRLGTVSVQNASTTVVGNGTNWDSNTCSAGFDWFYVEGDTRAYRCQYVSPTVLRLLAPYAGVSVTNKRYQQANLVGAGTQPFMQGIAGQAMMAHADVTGQALSLRYAMGAAQWLRFLGYRATSGGLYYGRLFPNCEPNPEQVAVCTLDSDGIGASRYLAGEVMGFLSQVFLASKDDALKALGDSLMTANFSRPGFSGPMASGNTYNENFDDNALIFTFKKAKDFGFWWGFGAAPGWLGARLGGVRPPQPVTNAVTFALDQVPSAAAVRVKVLAPNAAVQEYRCTESPCQVELDKRQGGHWITVDYVAENDEVLAPGLPYLVDPQ